MNAGAIVISRRHTIGICLRMNPCITTWPDSVPTAELDSPDATSASANSVLEAPPRIGSQRPVCALERVDVAVAAAVERARRHHQHRHVDQPGDRHRDEHVDSRVAKERPCILVGLGHEPVLGQRRVQVDHVRHDGRADDPDREQAAPATSR